MRRFSSVLAAGLVLCVWIVASLAAQTDPPQEPVSSRFDYENVQNELKAPQAVAPAPADSFTNEFLREQVTSERWYIVLLCIVSIVSLSVVLFFIKTSKDYSARDVVNASGLNLIIFGTIILVLIVDTHEQLTAAIGVLGAIAGYLFGTLQKRAEQQPPSRQAPKP